MQALLVSLLTLLVLLLLSGFFSGSETALFSLKKMELMRMSASKRGSDRMIASLMTNPQQILVSILLGNLLVNSLISSLTTQMMLDTFGEYGHLVAIVVVTPVIIVFGEIVPKIISISGYENFARRIILPMNFWHRFASPVRAVFVSGLNGLIRIFGIQLEQKEEISEEELELAVRLSVDRGTLKPDESEFINNVMRFSRKTAESVMVPRKEAIALSWGDSIDHAIAVFLDSDIVRAPVYRGNMDHIVGLVDSRELVACAAGMRRSTTINRFIHPIQFYPATIELSELLDDFLKRKIQMAVVVDEYGGTAGIVTLSSIISAVMGRGFSGSRRQDVRRLEDGALVVSGDIQLDDYNFLCQDALESTESETLGGYVTEQLEHFPVRGEELETGRNTIRVRSIRRNRIESLEIRPRGEANES